MPLVKYVIWIFASPSNSLLHVPVEHLRLVVREGRVQHVELVGLGEELQLRRCVGSISVLAQENWSGIDALLERDRARLADQRDVFAVVDGELDRVALGDGGEIDIPRRSGRGCQHRQQQAKGNRCFHVDDHADDPFHAGTGATGAAHALG